jgi:hypothetical protein
MILGEVADLELSKRKNYICYICDIVFIYCPNYYISSGLALISSSKLGEFVCLIFY